MDIFPHVGIALGRVDNPAVVLFGDGERTASQGGRTHCSYRTGHGGEAGAGGEPSGRLSSSRTGTRRRLTRTSTCFGMGHGVARETNRVARRQHGLGQYLGHRTGGSGSSARIRPGGSVVLLRRRCGTGKASWRPRIAGCSRTSPSWIIDQRTSPKRQSRRRTFTWSRSPLGLKGSVVPRRFTACYRRSMPFIAAVDEDSEVDRLITDHGCGIQIAPGDSGSPGEGSSCRHRTRNFGRWGSHAREAFADRYARTHSDSRHIVGCLSR